MSYFTRFTQWQNYVHYILLTLIIAYTAKYFGAPIDFKMNVILFLALFVGDSVIHLIFWILPEPLKWED